MVSVIIPCHNAALYVADALRCLELQFDDLGMLEVIVVDDGSSDESLPIVERLCSRFPRQTILHNTSAVGPSRARNQGIEMATGRYIAFLDADDWFGPGHLACLVRAADDIGCDFVRTDVIQTWGTERVVKHAPQGTHGRKLVPRDSILPVDRYTMVDHPWSQAGLYHRSLIDRGLLAFPLVGMTAEDRPWIWRLHLAADSFAVVDSPGFFWRKDVPTSLTSSLDRRRLGFITAMDRVRELVEADRDAERFLPKVVQTVFGLTEHHLNSLEQLDPVVQREFVMGVRALLDAFPGHMVADRIERLSPERRQALGRVLEAAPTGSGGRS